MHKKLKVSLLILFMITMVFMTACSKKDNTSTTPSTSATPAAVASATPAVEATPTPAAEVKHDPIVLTVLTWAGADDPIVKLAYEKFTKDYPWVTFKQEACDVKGGGDACSGKLNALIAAGTSPDLIWINDVTAFYKDNLLVDLAPYIKADADFKKNGISDDFLTKGSSVNGKVLALPGGVAPDLVYVNKDLLKKHGLAMPGNDWTYDQMRDLAKKATDPSNGEFGMTDDVWTAWVFGSLYPMANGHVKSLNLLSDDFSKVVVTPEVISDLTWIQEMQQKDHVAPTPKESAKYGFDKTFNTFLKGKAAFGVTGSWMTKAVKDGAKFDWDVLPLPKGSATQSSYNWIGVKGIYSGSKNIDMAYKFLSWTLNSMDMNEHLIGIGNAPVFTNDAIKKILDDSVIWKGKNSAALSFAATQCCVANANVPLGGTLDMPTTLYKIMFEGADVTKTLTDTANDWNKKAADFRITIGLK